MRFCFFNFFLPLQNACIFVLVHAPNDCTAQEFTPQTTPMEEPPDHPKQTFRLWLHSCFTTTRLCQLLCQPVLKNDPLLINLSANGE